MIDDLILGLATLITPPLAGLLIWQQMTISNEIKYLKEKLDECLGNRTNKPKP